jgi:hypothetical protein
MPFRLIALFVTLAAPASATEFEPVHDRATFLALVAGKTLHIGLYGLTLEVRPDGQITGSALGAAVTGTWAWQDGYFCRQMAWGHHDIKANCQLVEQRGPNELRFTVDRGKGQSAAFRLR